MAFFVEYEPENKIHNTPSGWYLLGLGVYPEYRRLGIGTYYLKLIYEEIQ